MWSSGQRSVFNARLYQVFREVVGLERGPSSLVSTAEELLAKNSRGFGLETREYGRGDLLRAPCDTLYPKKLAQTSRTKAKEFVLFVFV
jgi:hypothetical protein